MTTLTSAAEVVHLDVRPLLAAGDEPFDVIVGAAGRLPLGGTLEVTAPFEPVPLYAVMRRRGFARSTEARGPGEWVVTFRDTGMIPTASLADLVAARPETRVVFARYGLDLCCGGSRTLAFAAQAHGIDLDQLLDDLQAVSAS